MVATVPVEKFLLVLAAILIVAKVFGSLATRIGQPAVLGELIAGVVLGSSALNLIPHTGELHNVIALLAEVGVVILLFEIGLETDLREMMRVGPVATTVAAVGVVVPFALGYALWMLWQPDIAPGAALLSPKVVAVFIGATLTATSVGITTRVLSDLRRLATAEARVILGAAIVDDILGLIILAIVSALAAGAVLSVGTIALKFVLAIGFLVLAVALGRWVMPRVFERIHRRQLRGFLVVSAFGFALAMAGVAAFAGSALIIGSFAAGLVLSSTNQFDEITHKIQPVADIFTPIFFAYIGSSVDLSLLNPFGAAFNPTILIATAAFLAVAVVGKVVSGYSVGWGVPRLNHLAIGLGMIPRGEVGLIFTHLGLDSRIISDEGFNMLLLVVMLTTFLTPPLLKTVFARQPVA